MSAPAPSTRLDGCTSPTLIKRSRHWWTGTCHFRLLEISFPSRFLAFILHYLALTREGRAEDDTMRVDLPN